MKNCLTFKDLVNGKVYRLTIDNKKYLAKCVKFQAAFSTVRGKGTQDSVIKGVTFIPLVSGAFDLSEKHIDVNTFRAYDEDTYVISQLTVQEVVL